MEQTQKRNGSHRFRKSKKESRLKVVDLDSVIDEKIIQNMLHVPNGLRELMDHVQAVVEEIFSPEIESLTLRVEFLGQRIEEQEEEKRKTKAVLGDTEQFLTVCSPGGEGVPWTTFDLIKAVFFALFSLVSLAIGVNTLATYLIGSGFIVFLENPYLAYLFASVNIGITGLLKIGHAWQKDGAAKRKYVLCLLLVGLSFGVIWLITFSSIFPNIGNEDVEKIIKGLSEESSGYSHLMEGLFVLSQLIAEICISAAMWIYLEDLFLKHSRKEGKEKNPEYTLHEDILKRHNEELKALKEEQGQAKGRLRAIQATREALITQVLARWAAARSQHDGNLSNGKGPQV
jgi:hypothetical protein